MAGKSACPTYSGRMPPHTASQNLAPRWPLLAAVGLALVAAGLRLWQIHESLWLDELHTAWCATGSLGEVASRAAIGNQSPLFFWVEWLLVRLLRPSELALRLPSVVAGSLLPLTVFLLARRWSTAGVGLLAAAVVAIDPTSLFYATEARPYALVQLLGVIHMAITADLIFQPTLRRRAGWIAIGAVLFHLHYTAALLFPAELAFYGSVAMLRPRDVAYRWRQLALDSAVLTVLCLPALGTVLAVAARRANWAAFIPQQPLWDVFDWWPCALAAWYIAAAGLLLRVPATKKDDDAGPWRSQPMFALLLLCWLIVPTLLAWLANESDTARLFFPRYLIAVTPAAVLLAACCADLAPWRSSKIAVGSLILVAAIWSSGMIGTVRQDGRAIDARGEDWRGCIAWLNERLPETQFPVLVYSGLIEADALRQPHDKLLEDYCLLPVTSLYPLETERADMIPLPLDEPWRLDQIAEMLIVHRGGAWLIVRASERASQQIADEIVARLDRSATPDAAVRWHTSEPQAFGRLHVVRLVAREPNDPKSKVQGPK
jgi:mannosyltransferase